MIGIAWPKIVALFHFTASEKQRDVRVHQACVEATSGSTMITKGGYNSPPNGSAGTLTGSCYSPQPASRQIEDYRKFSSITVNSFWFRLRPHTSVMTRVLRAT